jgi:hypothetical protein
MPRYIRNTVILVKNEATAGTDAVPAGASNAMLVSDMSITPLDAKNIDRNLVRGYFGASEQLVGPASVKVSFAVELAGSGTAGTAPAWGAPLLSCAAAEGLLTAPARAEYTPISTGLKTSTIYYYDDGVLHKLVGVMGNAKLSMKVGDKPKIMYDFVGLDAGISAASAVATLSAWKTPVAMTKANVIDITLGATYALGAITGGQVYSSTGLELDFGNVVNFTPLLSNETVDITDRQSSGSTELDLTPAQEVAMMAVVKGNTTQSLALTIGLAAGNKIIVFAPAVQMFNPKKVDLNGKRLIGYDLRLVPTAAGSGNDEWRIVTQ